MNLRALKILVAAMGVVLVAGVVALAVGVAVKFKQPPRPADTTFTAPPVFLPHGSVIERISASQDRIVLQVDLVDGNVQLVVIDIATGRELGVIPLKESP
jgi:hypothetical protein